MEKLRRPYCVDTALILWIGVLALSALQILSEIVVSIRYSQPLSAAITEDLSTRLSALQEQGSTQGMQYSADELHLMAAAVPFTGIFMEFLLALLLALVIWRMSMGRKWARLALILFACYLGFQTLSGVIMSTQGLSGSFSPIAYYLSQAEGVAGSRAFSFFVLCVVILQGIVAMAALFQMRKLEADQWFNDMTAQRRPPMPPMPPLPPVPPNGPQRPR
ncbi:MAG: hypothetical protein SOR94_07325 [Lawsonella sp.]|uniref:hypothetical protein n=1 Tax=Lawsonella sp. TaxID=2041415 RepID=UPI002A763F21|nr:hypothetical protein [Lawsonella sp.]MDY2979821.1 hypothetical protein [Lawsonella sp.]